MRLQALTASVTGLALILCQAAPVLGQSMANLDEAAAVGALATAPGAGAEAAWRGGADAQKALEGEALKRRPAVTAGRFGFSANGAGSCRGSSACGAAAASRPEYGLRTALPPAPEAVPAQEPGREAGMGAQFAAGLAMTALAFGLMFLTPYAGIVKIAAGVAGAAIGAVAGYHNPAPITGNKWAEAAVFGAQLLGLGLYQPPVVAFIAGTLLAGPIVRLIDRIRGR